MLQTNPSSLRDWRLALKAGAYAAVAVLAKVVINALDWDTVDLNTLYSGLVAATVFLLGFLLAGTLADYKESERLPGELAARVETIADECQVIFRRDKDDPEDPEKAEPARRCLDDLGRLAGSINSWLRQRESIDGPLDRIQALNVRFLEFESLLAPPLLGRLKSEQNALRMLVTRIDTIRETSFVGAGYLIAEISSALLVVSLLIANIGPLGGELLLLAMITFVISYMILLIRDLDDPFDYSGLNRNGAAEVSLAPIERLELRIAARAASLG